MGDTDEIVMPGCVKRVDQAGFLQYTKKKGFISNVRKSIPEFATRCYLCQNPMYQFRITVELGKTRKTKKQVKGS
jgi:hypothetical protein